MRKIYCINYQEALKIREMLEDMMTSLETRFERSDLFGLTHNFKNIKAESLDSLTFDIDPSSILFIKGKLNYDVLYEQYKDKVQCLEFIEADQTEIVALYDFEDEPIGEFDFIETDYGCKIWFLWEKIMPETFSVNLSCDKNIESQILIYPNFDEEEFYHDEIILITNTKNKKLNDILCYNCKPKDIVRVMEVVSKKINKKDLGRFFDSKRLLADEFELENEFEIPYITSIKPINILVNIKLKNGDFIDENEVINKLKNCEMCKGYILNIEYGHKKNTVQFIHDGIFNEDKYTRIFEFSVLHTDEHLVVVSNQGLVNCLVIQTDDVSGIKNEIYELIDNTTFDGTFYCELVDKLSKFIEIKAKICENAFGVYFKLKNGKYLCFYDDSANSKVLFVPNRASTSNNYFDIDCLLESHEMDSYYDDDLSTHISTNVSFYELKLVLKAMTESDTVNKISEYKLYKKLTKLRDEAWVFERLENAKDLKEKLKECDRMFVHIATDKLDLDLLKEFDEDKILNTSISINSPITRVYILYSKVSSRELKAYDLGYL